MTTASDTRAIAMRVAKVLRERNRPAEALAVCCAAAAAFDNDAEGQALLAEALRIDQNSPLARMAFERMEGVTTAGGEPTDLDRAIEKYSHDVLAKLERTLRPGLFLKAQVGFNNNIKYKGHEFHIQTEDSGLDKPHIITHLFADGGRVIKSHKRSYASEVSRQDVSPYVRTLMKGQHMEMVLLLREGKFDDIVAGKASGGVAVLEYPPDVALDRIGNRDASRKSGGGPVFKVQGRAAPADAPDPAAPNEVAAAAPKERVVAALPSTTPSDAAIPIYRARLHVTRSLTGGPEFYDVFGNEAIIGTSGAVSVEGERFCHPREAILQYVDDHIVVTDLEGGNGVFLRINRRVELGISDEFLVGDQLCRLERNPDPQDGPAPGPTYFRSSLKWPSAFRVVQVFEGGAAGAVAMARGATLQVGSALEYANDLVLRDPLVAPYHCVVEEQADSFVLSDLGARAGVFVRVHGRHRLGHGAELMVGRTRLLVDLSPSRADLAPLG